MNILTICRILGVLTFICGEAQAQVSQPGVESGTAMEIQGSTSTAVTPVGNVICDAAGCTTKATVVPVSTQPVTSTSKALVVDLRPDSPGIGQDPCAYALPGSGIGKKASVAINVTSAATTSLVAVSGSTVVYVCGFVVSVSNVVTTANTFAFEYGTGAACSTPVLLTGVINGGSVTAGIPSSYTYGNGFSTIFSSAASNGICILTAIGATASFEGVLTYVQQ